MRNKTQMLGAHAARVLRLTERVNFSAVDLPHKPPHAGRVRSQVGLFFILLILVVACRNAEIKPEEFASEDVCTQCKMAISEKQFAAEFFTFEGEVRKFDDIGCMVDYLKANATTKPTVFFFIDYETKKWIKGNAVTLVKSDSLVTPMYGGIVAFDDQARATAAAPKIKGKVTSLEELTKK